MIRQLNFSRHFSCTIKDRKQNREVERNPENKKDKIKTFKSPQYLQRARKMYGIYETSRE